MLLPGQRMQQRTGEAAAETADLSIALLPVENGVERLQRPTLVEDDLVAEEPGSVEDDPTFMQIGEQLIRIRHAALLFTDRSEEGLRDKPVLASRDRQSGIGVAQRLQTTLYPEPAGADPHKPLLLPHPGDRVCDCHLHRVEAAGCGGTLVKHLPEREAIQQAVGHRWRDQLHLRRVAAALCHEQGTVLTAQRGHQFESIVQPVIAEGHAIPLVLLLVLGVRCPQHNENRPRSHEERVGAVIEFLTAEVPEM